MNQSRLAGGERGSTPFFSVVVPLYNKQPYVAATLASVVAQTDQDYEIIVVNDGSTDDSVAELAQYRDRIRLIEQENRGPGLARNSAASVARGTWLAFLDADDLWKPDHLAVLRDLIGSHPGCNIAAGAFEHYWNGARVSRPRSSPRTPRRGAMHYLADRDARSALFTSSTAVRADTFRALDGFGAVWPGEDSDLWIRLALLGPFAVTSRVTAFYMQNCDGVMSRRDRSVGAPEDARHTAAVRTLDLAILREPRSETRRVIVKFKDRLLVSAAKVALVEGRPRRAYTYLRALRRHSPESLGYLALTVCPEPILRFARSCLARSG